MSTHPAVPEPPHPPVTRRDDRRPDGLRYADSVLDLVGHTPLVRLDAVLRGPTRPGAVPPEPGDEGPLVLAKLEYLNPGGSVKDRIALAMIEAAEAEGLLRPGGTIVEPTTGNTGIGLAIAAQRRGYRCVFVCPDKVSEDKRTVLKAYGADVVVCPTAVEPSHPDSFYSVSDRLVREIPGAWKPDQYANPQGPAVHHATTGPEIWADTAGRVTHLVAGIGTGATISGAGRYLKEVSAGRPGGGVRVIGADPAGSVYSGGTGRPYLVEGVGEDFWPRAYDPSVPDEVIAVRDAEAFAMTRRLAREEGLLVGGSGGLAVAAAREVVARLTSEKAARAVVVVLLADGGRGYLGKIFDDRWLSSYGFLHADGTSVVGDVLRAKTGALPPLVHTHPTETIRDAVQILREYGVSTMPVVTAEPPVTAGEVTGAVTEKALLDAVFAGRAALSDPVGRHMGPPLPLVGAGEPVEAARLALQDADAVLVADDGEPVGVLTRHDLLGYAAG